MKIFISSVITGMESERAAAREAVLQLGLEPIMAEDFHAQPRSPQTACLNELRQSAAVVLLLGSDYGAKQRSGLSATHEEYRDARDRRPVIAFVQEGEKRDTDQAAFLREIQDWQGGLYRGSFTTSDQLRAKLTRALHEWILSTAARQLDAREMLERALEPLVNERDGQRHHQPTLAVSFVGGPAQAVLRPSELESPQLASELMQGGLFGEASIFDPARGSEPELDDDALVIKQDRGASISLDAQGSILLYLPLDRGRNEMALIQEHVETVMRQALRYATWVLDKIDTTQRLSHVVVAATVLGADYLCWRTQAEQNASPNSYPMRSGMEENKLIHLTPPERPRPALRFNEGQLVADLIALLKRQAKP